MHNSRDSATYEQWYQEHTARDLLAEAVYGLPELHGDRIRTARLVGNPGCYPTGVILAAAPLVEAGVIDSDSLIADCKSGVSGAGKEPTLTTHFCEANEGLKAYKVGEHRHTPEIEKELSSIAGRPIKVVFTPHLVPMSRGILLSFSHMGCTFIPKTQFMCCHISIFIIFLPFRWVIPLFSINYKIILIIPQELWVKC